MVRVGKCSVCGKDAAWNTPAIDENNNLYCNNCAYKSKKMLVGVSQSLDENGNYELDNKGTRYKNNCVLWIDEPCAWTNRGGVSFILRKDEKVLANQDPEKVLDLMANMVSKNETRCTKCGKDIKSNDKRMRILFAGVLCEDCIPEYNKMVQHQRDTGQVCSMCRQPYALCCC